MHLQGATKAVGGIEELTKGRDSGFGWCRSSGREEGQDGLDLGKGVTEVVVKGKHAFVEAVVGVGSHFGG